MEEIKEIIKNDNDEIQVSKVYLIDNTQVTVRRKFEKGGSTILEQVVSLLLDLMEKQSKSLTEN